MARPIKRPYELGTAQADAYFAGLTEGHAVWRERFADLEAKPGARP